MGVADAACGYLSFLWEKKEAADAIRRVRIRQWCKGQDQEHECTGLHRTYQLLLLLLMLANHALYVAAPLPLLHRQWRGQRRRRRWR